jgi:hypothetical protein
MFIIVVPMDLWHIKPTFTNITHFFVTQIFFCVNEWPPTSVGHYPLLVHTVVEVVELLICYH